MHVIIAPDVKVESEFVAASDSMLLPSVYVTAHVCQNDIWPLYLKQRSILDARLQEELNSRSEQLSALDRENQTRTTQAIVGVLASVVVLAIVLLFLLRNALDLPGIMSITVFLLSLLLVIAVFIFARRTLSRWARYRQEMIETLDGSIANLRLLKERLRPASIQQVGRVWWALPLVHLSDNSIVPLAVAQNLESKSSNPNLPLVTLVEQHTAFSTVFNQLGWSDSGAPHQERDQPCAATEAGTDQPDMGFFDLLQQLDKLQTYVENWSIAKNSAGLLAIQESYTQAQQLISDISSLLSLPSTELTKPDLRVLSGKFSQIELEGVLVKEATIWQTCCENASDWLACLESARACAERLCEQAVEAYLLNSQALFGVEGRIRAPMTDWISLGDQRPDVRKPLDSLRIERANLGKDELGGIPYGQWQDLLHNLQNASQEAYDKPWATIAPHISDLMREFESVRNQLNSVHGTLQAFDRDSIKMSHAFSSVSGEQLVNYVEPYRQSLRDIGLKLDQMHQALKNATYEYAHAEAALVQGAQTLRLRQVPSQHGQNRPQDPLPNLSAAVSLDVIGLHQNLAMELEKLDQTRGQIATISTGIQQSLIALHTKIDDSYTRIGKIGATMDGLKSSSLDLNRKVDDYRSIVTNYLSEVSRLVGRAEGNMHLLESDLEKRQEAIRAHRQQMEGIEYSYNQQVAQAKAETESRRGQLDAVQKQLAWLADDPDQLIPELTGVDKSFIQGLTSLPQYKAIEETFLAHVQEAVENGCQRVIALCQEREETISSVVQHTQGALKVPVSTNVDTTTILVPVWYVEWKEIENPEKPEKEHVSFRLIAPLRLTPSATGTLESTPLYPALEQYVRSFPLAGAWGGSFLANGPSPHPLVDFLRRSADDETADPEALIHGIQEAVEAGMYDRFVLDVMTSSAHSPLGFAFNNSFGPAQVSQINGLRL